MRTSLACRRAACVCLIALAAALLNNPGCSPRSESAAKVYTTPEAAAQALIAALKPVPDQKLLNQVLGEDAHDVLSSGDPVADQNAAAKFVRAFDLKHEIVDGPNGDKILQVGDTDWPLPIPIVHRGQGWGFDLAAGKEEMLARRIGENEIFTVRTLLAAVDAQREYAMTDPNHDGIQDYAQRFLSDPGQRNGLYWDTKPGEPLSPLGPLVGAASQEGYSSEAPKDPGSQSYHGYHYKILKGQGPNAPGGEADYVSGGHMIAGFGIIAWPTSYAKSGVMTFITSHDGIVYEKDLGPGEPAVSITLFDPGDGWSRVDPKVTGTPSQN